MKNIKILSLLLIAVIGLVSCEQDDELVFTAAPVGEFNFVNSFLPKYVLTPQTASNIAERFVFNSANFDVPTNINYQLQYSVIGDFTDVENVGGQVSSTEIALTVAEFLGIATDAGLDNDPNSAEPNAGTFSFRVRAYPGDPSSTTEQFSPTVTLSVELPNIVVGGGAFEVSSWGVVGSGYNNWGDFADAKFYTTGTPGVIVSYVNLVDGEIKFRENNTWVGDLGDANLDGILDADPENNIAVTAGDYKITINTNDNSYSIEPFSWGIVGNGYNNWGGAGIDAKLYYDHTTDTFKASVKLFNGFIKFRPLNTWSGDMGDANLDGILDTDSDNNIPVTEGHYLVTVDFKDNSYTIEEATVWGAVGSGFNNWGNNSWDHDGDAGTPDVPVSDAALTEIQPGVWFAENITLVDGQIKFRPNNTWNGDYGDANGDNILDQDADNNIDVTAGNYVVSIDFNDPSGPVYYLGKR
ncbi:SusE domain-containing protein [Flavobacteriaceae bacterium SZ-1-7]|uniref:SusE domain-containing protein n=1 Tax=Tamlana sedimenti TaxID=3134126 RepID=UPI003124F19E